MKQSVIKHLTHAGIFLILLVVIFESMPRTQSRFQYHFELGKPWGYELITAEFDFPIYKAPDQLQREQEEVMKDYTPYYRIDTSLCRSQELKLKSVESLDKLGDRQQRQLWERLSSVYKAGIIDAVELDRLRKEQVSKISVVNHNEAVQRSLGAVFTPRSAYTYILDGTSSRDNSRLRELDLNHYLVVNLSYDTLLSDRMRDNLMNSISLTEGMIQEGEKIIDRGEIVNQESYQILVSLNKAYEAKDINLKHNAYTLSGKLFLLLYFIAMLALYLMVFRPLLYRETRNVVFFCSLIGLLVVITCCILRFSSMNAYMVPFMWVPVLVRIFYDSRTALYTHMVTTLLLSLIMPAPFEFVVLQMGAGMVAIGSMKDMSQRSALVQTSLIIFASYSLIYTALSFATTGGVQTIDAWMYFYFGISAALIIVVYGLVYLIEKMFGFVSAITLIELTNVNSSLMLDFAERAPGTFQHSMQVSTLATEAAKRISADSLLVRTGALYHDIGKLEHPENYTENQQSGYNPLLEMSFEDAAQAVISHVTSGVKLARKNRLPNVIVNFILTHHGTSKVRYFYNSWLNAYPGEEPDAGLFTYPGPKPQSKEAGILMMADAVEARSRSLKEFTPQSIRQMVEQMVGQQVSEGQFSECSLTLRDIETIKQVFTEKLISMNHHRISYPEVNKR